MFPRVSSFSFVNSADHLYGDVFEPSRYRAKVFHTGYTTVVYSGDITTICLLDVTLYPFDKQVCHVEFDYWTLNISGAVLSNDSVIDLKNVRENGLWQLEKTEKVFTVDGYRDNIYRTLSFSFV